MGTKIHCRSYLPEFCSMRDLNEDSSSSSWPQFYGDKTVTNGQYYNVFMPRTLDGYPGHDKDVLKQKMLEHEAVFKNQVSELHRLYRVQRDMMDEVKRKEVGKYRASMEPASSSSLRGSQVQFEDAQKWHWAGFPLLNSGYGRTCISEIEIANSPVSCAKGNTTQMAQSPFQNGSTSKDVEVMDLRPLKVRKKLFDLHLPAEEYIDIEEGEKLQEYKVSDTASYACNGSPNIRPDSSMKLLVGTAAAAKIDSRIDASTSASCLRDPIGLADLNDPAQTEEPMALSSVNFLRCTKENEDTKGINQSNAGHLGINGETINAHDEFLINSSFESKVNKGGRFSHVHEAGSTRSNLSSASQGHQPVDNPLPSRSGQGIHNRIHHPPGIYPNGYGREDQWKQVLHHGFSERSHNHPNNKHLEPVSSQTPGSYPFFSSSSATKSWDHPVSSWTKPTSNFPQKVTTLEASLNSAAVTSRSLHPSAQSQEPSGGKWQVNGDSRLNPGLRIESKLNGFNKASTLGSKGLQVNFPSAGFDCLNCSRGGDLASDRSTNHDAGIFPKGSCHADSKPAIDINLNVPSKNSSSEVVILQDLNTIDGKSKPEDHQSALPWLKPKPNRVDEVAECCKDATVRDFNQLLTPKDTFASSDCEIARQDEIPRTRTFKKILGFPIFEKGVPENKPSSLPSTSASVDCHPERNNSNIERNNEIIDINVACESDDQTAADEPTLEKEKQKQGAFVRDYIDLNSCVGVAEDSPSPSYERKSTSVKITLEIDLEAPPLPESEENNALTEQAIPSEVSLLPLENKNEQILDKVLRNAAETMVAISSSCPQIHTDHSVCHPSESSLAESLLWFVDAVSSCANELDNTFGEQSRFVDGLPQQDSSKEIDDFEAMTLQLAETKEEDYMPRSFVPEVWKVDDNVSNALPTRARRGQARRGRQRRDFQRDILPGLASLSRHDVTEDLQTFGGLMRATGHPWNSGLTRRNGTRSGGARGRRRAVVETVPATIASPVSTPPMQQLTNPEGGLEDRSFMGWGKTTRRPRRQRCPAGNPAVALT